MENRFTKKVGSPKKILKIGNLLSDYYNYVIDMDDDLNKDQWIWVFTGMYELRFQSNSLGKVSDQDVFDYLIKCYVEYFKTFSNESIMDEAFQMINLKIGWCYY